MLFPLSVLSFAATLAYFSESTQRSYGSHEDFNFTSECVQKDEPLFKENLAGHEPNAVLAVFPNVHHVFDVIASSSEVPQAVKTAVALIPRFNVPVLSEAFEMV